MISADLLTEAANIVAGARNDTHGAKERSFDAIAGVWSAYIKNRKKPDADIDSADVAHMMVLMKMMRSQHGSAARDHWVDMCGYAAIAGELSL